MLKHKKITSMNYVEETLDESQEAIERKKQVLSETQTRKARILTRVSKHTGGNCLVTGNFLSLQTAICSSTPCINSKGQCTYLHQAKDLMSIVYEIEQKVKIKSRMQLRKYGWL